MIGAANNDSDSLGVYSQHPTRSTPKSEFSPRQSSEFVLLLRYKIRS